MSALAALSQFVAGADTFGFLVAALLFLRAHRKTGDSLFRAFSAAFGLLAANQLLSSLGRLPAEELPWIFLLRLAAFSLLIVAITAKNLSGRRPELRD